MTSQRNQRIRAAVIGGGHWGKNHIRVLSEMGQLAGVVDADPARAQMLATAHQTEALTFDAMLSQESIEAVVIATPYDTHFELAKRCLSAGKHCLVEKPLTTNTAEAKTLFDIAKANQVYLLVGHLMLHHRAFQTLLAQVASGLIGEVKAVHTKRVNLGKFNNEHHIWWSYAPHDVSMIHALLGKPTAVSAFGQHILSHTELDTAYAQLSFANGVRASIEVSWMQAQKEQSFIVVGTKGILKFSDTVPWTEKLQHFAFPTAFVDGLPNPQAITPVAIDVPASEPLRDELSAFFEVISGDTPAITGYPHATDVMDTLVQGFELLSADLLSEPSLPLTGGTVVNQAQTPSSLPLS